MSESVAGTTSAPPQEPAQPPAKPEPVSESSKNASSTSNSHPQHHGGRNSGNHYRNSGRSKRGGGGERNHGERGGGTREGSVGVANERRKRPDAQHYKPGAFNSRRQDDGGPSQAQDATEDQSQSGNTENARKDFHRSKGRRNQNSNNNLDQTTNKLETMSVNDEAPKSSGNTNFGGKRKNKKPEQARYVPKKSNEETSSEKTDDKDKASKASSGSGDKKNKSAQSDGSKNDHQGGKNKKPRNKRDRGNKETHCDDSDQPQQRQKQRNDQAQSETNQEKERGEMLPEKENPQRNQNHEPKESDRTKFHTKENSKTNTSNSNQLNGYPETSTSNKPDSSNGADKRPHQNKNSAGKSRNSDRGQRDHQRSRNDEYNGNSRPRDHGKMNSHEYTSRGGSRGGKREFRRGGGSGGNIRGGKNSRGNSPHGRGSQSHQESHASSPPVDRGYHHEQHQQREPLLLSGHLNTASRGGGRNVIRSPSPHSSQDARFSQSPPNRGRGLHGHWGGGRSMNRGQMRENMEWGNRYFRESSNEGDYYGDMRWDNRKDDRSGYRSRGHVKSLPASLPPRLQKARDQQYGRSDSSYQHHDKIYNRHYDESSWRGKSAPESYDNVDERTSSASPTSINVNTNAPTQAPTSSTESPRIYSDWSLEVEEEEEQKELRRSSSDRDNTLEQQNQGGRYPQMNHHGGGIIRIPSGASSTENWGGVQPSDNPAWRDAGPDAQEYQQRTSGGHQQQWSGSQDRRQYQQQQRFLFDPKNPNKPIPAPLMHGGIRPPSNIDSGNMSRFPVDPRFPPRMPPTGFAQGVGYRPPFPTGSQAPTARPLRPPTSNVPDWYDVRNLRIYTPDNTNAINPVTQIFWSDMKLRRLYGEGGVKIICELWNTEVMECRKNIQQAFEELLVNNLFFCAERDVEFHIWKIAFYQIVEGLKVGQKDQVPEVSQNIQKNIVTLLDEGMSFYLKMLDVLDATYNLNLEAYYDILVPRPTEKYSRCALISAQKCLLCLGDLARYKENILETSNYGKARQFYQKASNIEPRNGRPFNQLAILASNTKRKFEAVYYNMRCLQSKNAFDSSHQSLTVIFEDVKKKWEATERKRLEDRDEKKRAAERENEEHIITRGTHLRKEIWIRQDGGRRLHRTTSAQEADTCSELENLSSADLNRRFINTYLYLIGKLYTHINMDSFPETLNLLQKEFTVLVSRSPLPIDSKRLVQIMALNMFVIEHTKMKGGNDKDYRSAMQDAALQLAFEMYRILIARCNTLLQGFSPVINSNSQFVFDEEDLPTLLSAVKVWCDWLFGNDDMWHPVVSKEPFHQLAQLATHLEKLKPLLKPIRSKLITEEEFMKRKDNQEYDLVKLVEDAMLCGYNPWFRGMDWSVYRRYIHRAYPSTLAQDVRRLDAIYICIEYLEGLENPILKWSPPDNAHIFLADNQTTTKEKVNLRLSSMLAAEEDILEESYSDEDPYIPPSQQHNSGEDQGKLTKLKLRKDELERRLQEEREAKRMQREILAEHVNVTLEIRPRFLVPDTNCFIDYLPDLKRISNSNLFQLRVPLIVINELDGLSKGARSINYSSKEHAVTVSESARRALSYLREGSHNMKCVTSKGTVVSSMGVTTEEDCSEGKKNDDLILDACLNIAKMRSQQHQDQQGVKMRIVYREVVLLTNDRNLKLKAHITDVPVNKLPDFMQWAFASNSGTK